MASSHRSVYSCLAGILLATAGLAATPAAERPAVVPGSSASRPRGTGGTANLDPANDGWESEAFHESTQSQFKKLGHALEASSVDSNLSSILTAEFRCTQLRPSNLEVVFRDDDFVVRRAKIDSPLPSTLR